MAKKPKKKTTKKDPDLGVITGIRVGGFKSIAKEQEIEIRPLTILAGANSSGKSSMMQPLLLLKQTLEATFDPGALLIDGPNVRFTEVKQLLSRGARGAPSDRFSVAVLGSGGGLIATVFERGEKSVLRVVETSRSFSGTRYTLTSNDDVDLSAIPDETGIGKSLMEVFGGPKWREKASLVHERCFLKAGFGFGGRENAPKVTLGVAIENLIPEAIHLPGLRGDPVREYPKTAVGRNFPGHFEQYTASVIYRWQAEKDPIMGKVVRDLKTLGLASSVVAQRVKDTQIELMIGRLPNAKRGSKADLVSIADVGFGVSQVLPVVVAIHAARDGQLVYMEQPELHLHPRAQSQLGEVLGKAAKAGKRLVVETHSTLLILAVQSLIAEGKLSPKLVKLHWFARGRNGATKITSADFDKNGAFGDWPEDFAEVALKAEDRYLSAVEARNAK